MPALNGLTRRIALIQGAAESLTDSLTGRSPRIPRGNGVVFQCAVFLSAPQLSTLIDDWSGIASITMQVRKDSASGDALFDITVAIGSINTGLTFANWADRTGQHFSISLTATETNQAMPAGKDALPIYIAWQANRTGADPVFLGFTKTEIFEDGIGSSGTPVPGDPVYMTAAEANAAFGTSMILAPNAGAVSEPLRYFVDADYLHLWDPVSNARVVVRHSRPA